MPMGFGAFPTWLEGERLDSISPRRRQPTGHAGQLDTTPASGPRRLQGLLDPLVEPVVPDQPAAPVHPNLAGMTGAAGILAAVAKYLRQV